MLDKVDRSCVWSSSTRTQQSTQPAPDKASAEPGHLSDSIDASAADGLDWFLDILIEMVRLFRDIDNYNKYIAENERHSKVLQECWDGIDSIMAFLANPDDDKNAHFGRPVSEVERDLDRYRGAQIRVRENSQKIMESIENDNKELRVLEARLYDMTLGRIATALSSRLPGLPQDFFSVLECNHVSYQKERPLIDELRDRHRDIHEVSEHLPEIINKLDDVKRQSDAHWRDTVSAEREVAKAREALSGHEYRCGELDKRLETVSRARSRVFCLAAEAPLKAAGRFQKSEANHRMAKVGPKAQEAFDYSKGLPMDPTAAEATRRDLATAKKALSDANWELRNLRQTYRQRLAAALAPGDRSTGGNTRSAAKAALDRTHLENCNAATRHIKDAERVYQDTFKRGLDLGVFPEDWPE